MTQKLKEDLIEDAYERFLTTLSNKTRLAIIQTLEEQPKNVTEITEELNIHQTSVSHALRRLKDCGFVFVEKKGKQRIYRLNQETVKPLVDLMEEHVKNYCQNCLE